MLLYIGEAITKMVKDIKIENVIFNIVEKIKDNYMPEKIVLFGSHAKGNPNPNSDIDLLIVKDSDFRRDERDIEIRDLLREVKFPMDIFVYTPEEVNQFRSLKGSFINNIFKDGEVLYEQ